MKKVGIITSGGDCQGMNTVIFELYKLATAKGIELVGFIRGYEGILKKQIYPLTLPELEAVKSKGGTILKSSRCQEMYTPEGQLQVFDNLKSLNIEGLIIIGGDGSAKGAKALYDRFNFPAVVIPATIDNDIEGVSLSLGYLSAIDRAVTQLSWIEDTATSHDRVFIVEVMGRHSGNLAKGVAQEINPLATVLPDTEVTEELLANIKNNFKQNHSHIILITELQEKKVQELKSKLSQEYDVRVNILGHGQRGGPPTVKERKLAKNFAKKALNNLLKSKLGMVTN